MSEQWWIDIDWEDRYRTLDYEIGSVNLAQLASIQIRDQLYTDRVHIWEILGTFNHGGWIIIHAYKNKENAIAALKLLQRFLRFDEDEDFIELRELRQKLAEVGKC